MAITHWVKAKSGDTYTDRSGAEKDGTVTIGRMIESARGAKMIILDCIPFSWFSEGKPVVLYLNAKDEVRGNNAPLAPPAQGPSPPPEDDDLPFR
jgi:hypothetical protein